MYDTWLGEHIDYCDPDEQDDDTDGLDDGVDCEPSEEDLWWARMLNEEGDEQC